MAQRSSPNLALQVHKDQRCDCYDLQVAAQHKRCNYRQFIDNWSFIVDVGNAQTRGEIFTPRWVVDMMIVKAGILPTPAVYQYDYSQPRLQHIHSRVYEPAVGSANYLATILYHKLRYAAELSIVTAERDQSLVETADQSESARKESLLGQANRRLDLEKYHTHLLIAIASVYANDIDVGNLEVTKRRLLSAGKHPVNDAQTIDQWTLHLMKWFNHDSERRKISYATLKPAVQLSLLAAHRHWNRFVKDGHGIIDSGYRAVTGEKMPSWLYDQCQEILTKNILLFNGIKETDTLDWQENFFVPGYRSVEWTWWDFDYPQSPGWHPVVSEKTVPFLEMISNTIH
jgi:hypothetical protein